jgi:hypothetical protein
MWISIERSKKPQAQTCGFDFIFLLDLFLTAFHPRCGLQVFALLFSFARRPIA